MHLEATRSTSVKYNLLDIQKREEILKLNILGRYYGDTMADVVGFALFVIEVNKNDIENITDIVAEVRY